MNDENTTAMHCEHYTVNISAQESILATYKLPYKLRHSDI